MPSSEIARPAATQAPADQAASDDHAPSDPRTALLAWLKAHVPHGGQVDDTGGSTRVIHVASAEETYASIAAGYVDLTDIYLTSDVEKAIRKENSIGAYAMQPKAGDRLVIPSIVASVPKSPDEDRLAWPDDHALRGVYIRGGTAQSSLYTAVLSRMAKRNMNMIVLDAKDYDGLLTYKSQVPLAVETGATKSAPIRNFSRTIRFAHSYGIRVAVRVSCFEDEFMTKAKPNLSVQSKYKGPYKIGWMDPSNEDAEGYILSLVTEAIDLGADEIELDYVRYP
ncbi:MAG TPA: putative glycoside hydrolase, partial [Polyangiaceae bacterium]